MKKFILLLPCLFIGILFFTGQKSDDKPQKWSIDPRMTGALDPNVIVSAPLPMVYDYFEPNPQTNYYRTPNGVFVVNANVRVLPKTNPAPFCLQSEVIITRHPLNPLIMYGSSNAITSNAAGNGIAFISEGAYVTTNGGTTWFGSDSMKTTGGTPLTGHGGDPGIAIDKDGRFIVSHLGGGIKANYSTNNGLNWSADVTITTGSQDKNLTTTDDSPTSAFYGRSYTAWSRFTASSPPIAFSYTTNGGVSWSASADVNVAPASHYSQGVDLRTGPNGEVYLCWAQPVTTTGNVEDYCGFAKSTNGGVNWAVVNNNIFDMNGIRGNLLSTNIRVNSFPRIDVDRTCGARAGWIYIVVSQKNLAPAGTDADIVIHKSTDGGTSWSAGVKVNQDALNNGKSQWFPAVRVDESGAVNVVYYDNRNPTTTDTAEVYVSRSTDGGVTFTDLKVSDHRFKPKPYTLSGIATGYQGDYIGITSGLVAGNPVNGNQRLFPLWSDDASGIYQAWTTKVELLPSSPCPPCEDFSGISFTPNYFNLETSGTQYWTRDAVSGYGSGSGSAKFDFFNASVIGTTQSLVTSFEPVAAGYYLTFDEAYAAYGAAFPGPDSLYVESSTNGGTNYTKLAGLSGKFPDGGELNTAPATVSQFVPTSSQWAPKIYSLPAGTNRVRLRAVSGYGNNLYIDNVCVQNLAASTLSSISVFPQGFYRNDPVPNAIPDTARMYLHRVDFPNIIVDSATTVYNSNAVASPVFNKVLSGSYYLEVRHRNSINLWSKAGGMPVTRGTQFSIDFVNNISNAYNSNLATVDGIVYGPYYGMYGGDIDRNGFVDLSDINSVFNDASAFVTGYVATDVTGDNYVDLSDILLTYNNSSAFVSVQKPAGAEPEVVPFVYQDEKDMYFENESNRQKYESGKKFMEENKILNTEKVTPNWNVTPPDNYQNRVNHSTGLKKNSYGNTFGNP